MMFMHHKNYLSSMTLKRRKIIRKLKALVSYSQESEVVNKLEFRVQRNISSISWARQRE